MSATGHSLTLCWGYQNEKVGDGWYFRLNIQSTKKLFNEITYFPMRAGNSYNNSVLSNHNTHIVVLNDISDKDVIAIKEILKDRKVVSPHSEDTYTSSVTWLNYTIIHGALSPFLSESIKHKIKTSAVYSSATGLVTARN
ncbi:hypothetical protein FA13DRAFT_1721107 [Coprinellus micaceus]|jgi:hypothetical protein|uniref:Uncharacterized protein n=1 Tax=Coprinellus micaceus TaxID=71717 RepID=A0A4Y7S2Y9_COPMI|nr:hypothetical protein FA13DRAFT_1721107 [Coprinellus micaceus]